ncbi:NIL domain-containing protein [Dehalococcoidia bacterium]|nr:NIL domain-containing protein [Dehalococcoidia bacterium]
MSQISQRVKFTFQIEDVKDPIIYNLGKNFDLITNIRRADINDEVGWVILEVQGEENSVTNGLEWITTLGVRVDPIGGDIIEG